MKISDLKAKKVACRLYCNAIFDFDGHIWIYYNKDKNLSHSHFIFKSHPIKIRHIKAIDIACSNYQIIIIDTDRNVWIYEEYGLDLKLKQIPNIKTNNLFACNEQLIILGKSLN